MVQAFEAQYNLISANDSERIRNQRKEAIELFKQQGFPGKEHENWRNTDLYAALQFDYQLAERPESQKVKVEELFVCDIHDFDTTLATELNGFYVYDQKPLTKYPNGVVVGSLAQARIEYPELIEAHYGTIAKMEKNGLIALNTAFAQDGFFVYVPDKVVVDKPIQLLNLSNGVDKLFVQSRNLVIVGDQAQVTLVHCDDSVEHKVSFINSVSEIHLGRNADVDHYKLQNKDSHSTLINTVFFRMENDARLNTNAVSLNGGIIRNDMDVLMDGKNCEANVQGLYLMDKDQHVDNQVYIDHARPQSVSHELFKGIVDDNASAVFNGHILVRKDSQQTNAFQTNRNIILTDKARVNTKPFLEIYADDVKCSHGATVGQLDDEALFYLRTRGICEDDARLLLMYAFVAEVVNKIRIPVLRDRIDDMVKKRLRGELSICDQCVLVCKSKENTVSFDIDTTKI